MRLDNEQQQAFLLEVLGSITLPAPKVDLYVAVRDAVRAAEIGPCASCPTVEE